MNKLIKLSLMLSPAIFFWSVDFHLGYTGQKDPGTLSTLGELLKMYTPDIYNDKKNTHDLLKLLLQQKAFFVGIGLTISGLLIITFLDFFKGKNKISEPIMSRAHKITEPYKYKRKK